MQSLTFNTDDFQVDISQTRTKFMKIVISQIKNYNVLNELINLIDRHCKNIKSLNA